MSNDAISETEMKNTSEHIHHDNVVIEFISLNNDSSAQKDEKLVVKVIGINYGIQYPPSQNIAHNCVDVEIIS